MDAILLSNQRAESPNQIRRALRCTRKDKLESSSHEEEEAEGHPSSEHGHKWRHVSNEARGDTSRTQGGQTRWWQPTNQMVRMHIDMDDAQEPPPQEEDSASGGGQSEQLHGAGVAEELQQHGGRGRSFPDQPTLTVGSGRRLRWSGGDRLGRAVPGVRPLEVSPSSTREAPHE